MLKLRSGKELIELPNKKKKKKTFAPKRIKHKETSQQLLTEESSDVGSGFETSKEDRTQREKSWEFFDE